MLHEEYLLNGSLKLNFEGGTFNLLEELISENMLLIILPERNETWLSSFNCTKSNHEFPSDNCWKTKSLDLSAKRLMVI